MDIMKSVCVIATLAAAVSTSAVAKELKHDKKATVPAVAATQMSDSEMDKVTAGAGYGLDTAAYGPGQGSPQGSPPNPPGQASGFYYGPGYGNYTR